MDQRGTSGESSVAAGKYNALVQEHLENTRIMKPIKHVCEVPNNAIVALLLQELQPTSQPAREDEYGTFSI